MAIPTVAAISAHVRAEDCKQTARRMLELLDKELDQIEPDLRDWGVAGRLGYISEELESVLGILERDRRES